MELHWGSRSWSSRPRWAISRQRVGECDVGPSQISKPLNQHLKHRSRLRGLNLKHSPARGFAFPPPLPQGRFFFFIVRKHDNISWCCSENKKQHQKFSRPTNSIDRTSFNQTDSPAREVAASLVSSSPGALSMSMSVAVEVGLERYKIHSVTNRNTNWKKGTQRDKIFTQRRLEHPS